VNAKAGRQVAVVLPYKERFAPVGGGAISSVVHDMGMASRRRTDQVVLGSPVADPHDDMHFMPVHWQASWWRSKSASYVKAVIAELRRFPDADIEVHNRPKYIPALRRAFPDRRITLYLHNDISLFPSYRSRRARQAVFDALDAVICVSRYIARQALQGLVAAAADKVHVVLNGVHTELYVPGEKRKVIVFGGRLTPEKGAHVLLDALAPMMEAYPDWSVSIVGGVQFSHSQQLTDYERRIAEQVDRIGGQAVMTGYVPRSELRALMAEAEIVVIPSIWDDPCPLMAVEAMASGCCVVGTPRGGLPEILGDAGVAVQEDDPQALGAVLERLMEGPDERRSLQEQARKRAVAEFDSHDAADRLDKVRGIL